MKNRIKIICQTKSQQYYHYSKNTVLVKLFYVCLCVWQLSFAMVLDKKSSSLAASVFRHSLGSFTDGVFGQFTGKKQPDSGLYLSGTNS